MAPAQPPPQQKAAGRPPPAEEQGVPEGIFDDSPPGNTSTICDSQILSLAGKGSLFRGRGETGDRLESDLFNPDGDSDSGTPTPVCPDEAEEVADLATDSTSWRQRGLCRSTTPQLASLHALASRAR